MGDATVSPEQNVLVFGQGYQGGTDVQLTLDPTDVVLRTVAAAAEGTFSTTVRIPSGTAAGAYSIVSAGLDPASETLSLEVAITVAAAPSPPPTTTADPLDGSPTPALGSTLAFLLAIAGLVYLSAMYVGRRQRR